MLIQLETGNAELLFLCLQDNILIPTPLFTRHFNRYNANIHLRPIPGELIVAIVKLANSRNWEIAEC